MLENVCNHNFSHQNVCSSSGQLRRIRAAANESREVPVVSMGKSVEDFFHDLEKDTNHGQSLPNWHGELYLEVCIVSNGHSGCS